MYEIKVITLPESKDRQECANRNLSGMNFEFSPGYSFKDLKFTQRGEKTSVCFSNHEIDINESTFLKYVKRNWFRFGEIGNYAAHYDIWKNIVQNDIQYTLVFEDDVKPNPGFDVKYIDFVLEHIREHDYDLCYLQSTTPSSYDPNNYSSKNNILRMIGVDMNSHFFDVSSTPRYIRNALIEGTASYLISLSGAKKLVVDCDNNGWSGPVDNMVNQCIERQFLKVVMPIEIENYFTLDSEVGTQSKSLTHSGAFTKNEYITKNLVVSMRDNEEILYA